MKKMILFIVFLSVTIGNAFGIHLQRQWGSCNDITLLATGYILPTSEIWYDSGFANCPLSSGRLKKDRVKNFAFILEFRLSDKDDWIRVSTKKQDGIAVKYDLFSGVQYRCIVGIKSPGIFLAVDKNCHNVGMTLGGYNWSSWAYFEGGKPVPAAILFGPDTDGVICSSETFYYLWLNASGSFAEDEFFVQIRKTDSPLCDDGGCPWVGQWYFSEESAFISLYQLWTSNDPNWTFWPGTYIVDFAVKKDNCEEWIAAPSMPFTVWACREGKFEEELELKLYPNPSSYELIIENLNTSIKNIEYEIINSIGRLQEKGTISKSNIINIENLINGTYFLRIVIDGEVSTKKFLVVK